MPRKIRQLKAELKRRGFTLRSSEGSHFKWGHELLPGDSIILCGNDGDDAKRYQERDVKAILSRLRNAQRR